MGQEEGALFVLRRARYLDSLTGSEEVQQLAADMPPDYAAASELVRKMEGLPLALDQVGAYIEET